MPGQTVPSGPSGAMNSSASPPLRRLSMLDSPPAARKASEAAPASWMRSEEALSTLLEKHGVNTQLFGVGSAKTISQLLGELRGQSCFLEFPGAHEGTRDLSQQRSSQVLRIVEPVFIRLRWRGRVLVQESQRMVDGRMRQRNMLLAEKKEPSDGGGFMATVVRGLNEELGIPREVLLQDGALRYRPDTYHFEIEQIESPSYPSLLSVYRTHHVQVDILDGGLHLFSKCGLPGCTPFTTSETSSLGTTTHFWRWSDAEKALQEGVVKFPPKMMSSSSPSSALAGAEEKAGDHDTRALGSGELSSEEALAGVMRAGGIDPASYGTGKAKSLSALLKEVQGGESCLERTEGTPGLQRVVEPVFVQLRWGDRVLVEVEQRLSGGTTRQRNMLLAEKKNPNDADAAVTAIRGIFEELDLPSDLSPPEDYFQFVPETYCCLSEHMESASFPGLPCVYTTHYCSVQVVESGLERLRQTGILEDEFETKEADKVNVWRWTDTSKAHESKVKGLPDIKALSAADAGDPSKGQESSFEPVGSVPLEPGLLRALLEMGGVNVCLWGEFTVASLRSLADELETGASRLERDVSTGRLRRVVNSSLVHFNLSSSAGRDQALDNVQYRQDLECFEVVHVDFASYPGLPCVHQTRRMQFDEAGRGRTGSKNLGETPRGGGEAIASCAELGKQSSTPADVQLPRLIGRSDAGSAGPALQSPKDPASSRVDISRFTSTASLDSDCGTPFSKRDGSVVSISSISDGDDCLMPTLYSQLQSIRSKLRFKMVAKEQTDSAKSPPDQVVVCSCSIQLIRNVNPLNSTFQCRFTIFVEWLDKAAVGLPTGDLDEASAGLLSIPEIELQNTLATSLKIRSRPRVVSSETGHVACKILYQALVQMELDMRLFPFDAQRLVLVLGLRARRDRDRVLACQFCRVDESIRLEEWQIMRSFAHSDSPDGRARIQFGVMISRRYWYYLVNVFITLIAIVTSSFTGFVLPDSYIFDRLRIGVAVLFAQITFRLSQDNKLPKVAYATIFDQYAMFCQLTVLGIIFGNIVTSMLGQGVLGQSAVAAAGTVDLAFACLFFCIWTLGQLCWLLGVSRRRHMQHRSLLQLASSGADSEQQVAGSGAAQQQLVSLRKGLHYRGPTCDRSSVQVGRSVGRAVSVDLYVWLLHDISPMTTTFECKFSVTLGWLDDKARGLPEGTRLMGGKLGQIDVPDLDIHNKVESVLEEGPCVRVVCSTTGEVSVTYRFHAKVQMNFDLRQFPFDSQHLLLNITMPNEKDKDRAFVYRSHQLDASAQSLDEWIIQGHTMSPDVSDDLAMASFRVDIRRRSFFYVVSVLAVLLGISSLVFTVFVIPMQPDGLDYVNQGKILAPLFMTLLAFKLLTASGKLPTVASATNFDRYMLACELMFFVTIVICGVSRELATMYGAYVVQPYRVYAALMSVFLWLVFNVCFALGVGVRPTVGGGTSLEAAALGQTQPFYGDSSPAFEEQSLRLQSRGSAQIAGPVGAPSAVMLRVAMQSVHSVNPADGTFQADFVAGLEWLCPDAVGLDAGSELSGEQLELLQRPKLMVQNAISCSTKVLGGARVVDPATGHVTCKVHVKAQVQVHFQLGQFPFDEQVLEVVLILPDMGDKHRSLVIEHLDCADVARLGEWVVLGDVSSCGRRQGISWASVGVQIRRSSRYYVLNLVSLSLWATFGFAIYALEVDDFQNRGKILVGVLLVQIVSKLVVSSKLPRIARTTLYDRVALNNLAMLFCIGCSAALCCVLNSAEGYEEFSRVCDLSLACAVLLLWVVLSASTALQARGGPAASRHRAGESAPDPVAGKEEPQTDDAAAVAREVAIMRPSVQPEPAAGAEDGLQLGRRPSGVPAAAQDCGAAVSIGATVQFLTDLDTVSGTVECKFHVFLDWKVGQGAMRMQRHGRISRRTSHGGSGEEQMAIPQIKLLNATKIMMEDYSDVSVVDVATGHVSCRVQFHARIHNKFDLRSFPFDCQRLQVELELQGCPGRFLVGGRCGSIDQNGNLDGWTLRATSLDVDGGGLPPRRARVSMLVERSSRYYLVQVIAIFACLATLVFSFYVVEAQFLDKRIVDALKIVLTMTTFRFSVEHRLPRVQHWTPFDIYHVSCQVLCTCIIVSFIVAKLGDKDGMRHCQTREKEVYVIAFLSCAWVAWHICCGIHSLRLKGRDLRHLARPSELRRTRAHLSQQSSAHPVVEAEVPSAPARQLAALPREAADGSGLGTLAAPGGHLGVARPRDSAFGQSVQETQVISIAFRIWLVRNVDLVTGTFECKFRVFLEWVDVNAVGRPKGQKAKLPVPDITITNAIQSQLLDASSAPEVVNPDTGHLAAQKLYKCTMRMDQEVRHFPFDWQWLAITVSMRDEGEFNRPFFFQYCEMEGQLQLDEWHVHDQPAFTTLSKHDAPSSEDTVMCGILIRRQPRYYVVNILFMLGLITSLCFSIYPEGVFSPSHAVLGARRGLLGHLSLDRHLQDVRARQAAARWLVHAVRPLRAGVHAPVLADRVRGDAGLLGRHRPHVGHLLGDPTCGARRRFSAVRLHHGEVVLVGTLPTVDRMERALRGAGVARAAAWAFAGLGQQGPDPAAGRGVDRWLFRCRPGLRRPRAGPLRAGRVGAGHQQQLRLQTWSPERQDGRVIPPCRLPPMTLLRLLRHLLLPIRFLPPSSLPCSGLALALRLASRPAEPQSFRLSRTAGRPVGQTSN
ncbi:unnamed protein product [Prorocentrum cordatum]|uniref:Uncharacterized protein n=1 Tax=Prorocentrum cordatum TaxID=2364126 RepID=A0ABN9RFB1_9DINO|nr:unnamed protein product [Polarella glacialis]CAK0817714.1 unnamed protein product [Polarella glacialis]